ncbi:MAG: DUF4214 domain-containing protein [Actinomycetota bacterium]
MSVPPPGHARLAALALVVFGLTWSLVLAGRGGASVPEPVRPEEGEILRLYRSALGRDPDPGGYRYWVTRRIEGVPLVTVAHSFLVGREFEQRFGTGGDAAFIDRVYRHVLGRDGDADGTAYWRAQLAAGLPRHDLVLLFSESAELRRRTGTESMALPAFRSEVASVSASDLGASWRVGCPVGPTALRAVTVDHVDAAGGHARGTLIVHRDVVDEVVTIFDRLYAARYPITSIRPVDQFGADDDASMAADNTSGYNCRAVTGGTSWSRHAFGTAIDINPISNPYVRGSTVLPPTGGPWVDRTAHHPAMIRPGDVVTRAFADAGWRWGGDFVSLKDYQHFDRRLG